MNKIFKYDAFISYRHTDLDKSVADKLQKMLETYKPPRVLKPESFKGWHVFRDETELPTSANLSEDIKKALENSEFLIVICSKTTKQSRWCMEEIRYFKALHNGSNTNIITLVVEGEPSEIFPDELCNEAVPVKDSNGNLTYETRIVEPLAASITAATKQQSLKKLKTEFLRIAAPLLGCGYNDLYDRDQRRKTKRTITVCAAVTAVTLLFGIYSSAMLLKINSQRQEILVQNSHNLGRLSESLWQSGDSISAIETAISALPTNKVKRPIIPNLEKILAGEIHAFEQSSFRPVLRLTHDKVVKKIGFTGGGETIVTQDDNGVYFRDSRTGELKNKIDINSGFSYSAELIFENENIIRSSSLEKYSASTFIFDENGFGGYRKAEASESSVSDSNLYLVSSSNQIAKVNGRTGDIIWMDNSKSDFSLSNDVYINNNSIVRIYEDSKSKIYTLDIHSRNDMSLLKTYTLSGYDFGLSMGEWLHFTETKVFCNDTSSYLSDKLIAFDIQGDTLVNPTVLYEYPSNEYPSKEDEYTTSALMTSSVIDNELFTLYLFSDSVLRENAVLNVYDTNSGALKWSHEINNTSGEFSKVGKIYAKDSSSYCDIIFTLCGNKLLIFNADTGEKLHEYTFTANAVEMYYSLDGMIYVITETGVEIAVTLKNLTPQMLSDPDFIGKFTIHEFISNIAICGYHNNRYAVAAENSNEVYVYSDSKNEDFTEIFRNEENTSIDTVLFNNSGTSALINAYSSGGELTNTVYVYDTGNKTVHELDHFTDYITVINFIDDRNICISSNKNVAIYDAVTLKKLCSYDSESYVDDNKLFITDGTAVLRESDKLTFITPNGTSQFEPKSKSKFDFREWDPAYIQDCYPSPDKRIMVNIEYYDSDSTHNLEIFNTSDKTPVVLETNMLKDGNKVINCVWSEKQVFVLFNDNTLHRFNTETGKFIGKATLEIPSPLSMVLLNDETVAVLCGDSVLYRVDIESGKTTSTLDLENDHIVAAGFDYSCYKYVPDRNLLILDWGLTHDTTYFIDLESFTVRYTLNNYRDYSSSINLIAVNEYNIAGTVPMFSTEELVKKANEYIGK